MPISAATAAIAAPIVGAGLGAISGSKGGKTTTTSAPNLPDNVKKAWDKLLENSQTLADRPYQAPVTTRVDASNMYGGLFNNPELQAIQGVHDRKLFDDMLSNGVPVQPKTDPANAPGALNQIQGMQYLQSHDNRPVLNYVTGGKTLPGVQDYSQLSPDQIAQIGKASQNGTIGQMNPELAKLLSYYTRGR